MTTDSCLLTYHAQHRCSQMGLTIDDVASVLRSPQLTYPSPPEYGPGRMISVADSLAVVHRGPDVITVLWHGRTSRT